MSVETALENLDNKLDDLAEVATETRTEVKNIKEGFSQHREYCREDMEGVYKVMSGSGGHGERITTLETKWKLFTKKGFGIAAVTAGGGTGIGWFIIEYVIPFLKKLSEGG